MLAWLGGAAALLAASAALVHFAPWKKGDGSTNPVVSREAASQEGKPFVNTLEMKFVPVPGTPALFSIWDTRVKDYAAYARANKVDDQWTKQEQDGLPVSREPDYPVVGVSWEDAKAFCRWLTEKESAEGKLPKGMAYRLPTDEEWSRAVGLAKDEGATPKERSGKDTEHFPWGTTFPPPKAKLGNYADAAFHEKFPREPWIAGYNDGYAATSPVGSFAPNQYGLYDMGGNVWQWLEDLFESKGPDRARRGASFNNNERAFLLSSYRSHHGTGHRASNTGFRCVLAPAAVPFVPGAAPQVANGAPATKDQPSVSSAPTTPAPQPSSPSTPAPTAAPKPPSEIEKWLAQVDAPQQEAFQKQVLKPFETGVADLRVRYRAALDARIARASAANLLDEALAWRTEKQAFEKAQDVASDDAGASPAVKALRADFRQQFTQLDHDRAARAAILHAQYDAILAQNQTLLTQRSRLDDALQLKAKRDEIARAWLGPAPFVIVGADGRPAAAKPGSVLGATTDQPLVNSLDMKFVPVPIIGGPTAGQRVLFSVWDTRVQDYEVFAKETGQAWPKADFPQGPTHPAVNVSWNDAQLFCKWLTARDHTAGLLPAEWSYRLPSDHEWSCAVEIGAKEDAAAVPSEKSEKIADVFPWGAQWPPPKGAGNFAGEEAAGKHSEIKGVIAGYNDGFVYTSPVGSFPANRFGLFDMAGNAWQWCEDWHDKRQVDHVLRGGSWIIYQRRDLLASRRYQYLPGARFPNFGFRCVLAPSRPVADGAKTGLSNPPATAPTASSGAATVATASQEAPFVNGLGMKFVPVPIVGGPSAGQRVLFGVWDTRVQDYEIFAKETGRGWPKADFPQGPTHPAVMVNWDDAQAFCEWLKAREQAAGRLPAGWGYRLPSDHEWSCAVGLEAEVGQTPAERNDQNQVEFPWGRDFPPGKPVGNYAEQISADGFVNTSPVGSFPANRHGLYDMGGNVWQWCEDWVDASHRSRALRGASWSDHDRSTLLSSHRLHNTAPLSSSHLVGFRCVIGASAS